MLNLPLFGLGRRQCQRASQIFCSGRNHGFEFTHREAPLTVSLPVQSLGEECAASFFEGMNDEDALRGSGEVEDAKVAIFTPDSQFRDTRIDSRHRPRVWHPECLADL